MSLPTSVALGLLVVAWLAVLVPIVSKRRAAVPEFEEGTARFRVLRRSESESSRWRMRRRGVGGASDAESDVLDEDGLPAAGELDELDEVDELDETENAHGDLQEDLLDEHEYDSYDEWDEAPATPPAATRRARRDETDRDSAEAGTGRYEGAEDRYDDEAEGWQPAPHKPGRGGFDPEAEAEHRAYRFQRRRRVTTILVLLTLVSAVVAYLVGSVMTAVTVLLALTVIGYLTYLRRQVKVEAEVRRRRMARMRRAAQVRPEYHAEPSYARAASVPPVTYHRTRQVVDLDDDDPSFDDLDRYEEPYAYRRAVGQ